MNSLTQHNKKSRIEYLDIAKGLLILLVIRGHLRISFLPEFFHEDSFYRIFHVSAFLVLGGGYYLKMSCWTTQKKRLGRSIISYSRKHFTFSLQQHYCTTSFWMLDYIHINREMLLSTIMRVSGIGLWQSVRLWPACLSSQWFNQLGLHLRCFLLLFSSLSCNGYWRKWTGTASYVWLQF